ncbi:MAG: hypothetical protein AB7O67_01960 [Vicinamibacterales bacterium]
MGSVTSLERRGGGKIWRLVISATADEQGQFAPVDLPREEFAIVSCRTIPGQPAPSALDVTAPDQHAIDMLRGCGLARPASAPQDTIVRWAGTEVHPVVDEADTLTLRICGNRTPGARVDVVLRLAAIEPAPSTRALGGQE